MPAYPNRALWQGQAHKRFDYTTAGTIMMYMGSFKVFISAGETSADILGAAAVRDVQALIPDNAHIEWRGLAGAAMREAGVVPCLEKAIPSAAGLLELLPRAGEMLEFRRKLHTAALEESYNLAVLIDMPDLHLPLGKRLEAAGVPVLLYVPPQTWAWRSGRALTLKQSCQQVAVLFEFEKRHLAGYGVEAAYVGHPIFERWCVTENKRPKKRAAKRVALMPGSRRHEIACNLPPMLEAAGFINSQQKMGFDFEVIHTVENSQAVKELLGPSGRVALKARSEMQFEDYDLALCGAGTASLELAASGTPFILCHRVNALSYALARRMLKTGLAAMPNILIGYAAAPELLQGECRAIRIADEILQICSDGGIERQKRAWSRLGVGLKEQPRDTTVARLILDMLDIKPRLKSSSESA